MAGNSDQRRSIFSYFVFRVDGLQYFFAGTCKTILKNKAHTRLKMLLLSGVIPVFIGRLFEALEPMYFALETHKDSTERLEGLMMELAKTIQQQQAAASFGKVLHIYVVIQFNF